MRNCNSGLFILPFVSGIKFVEQIKFHTFCEIFFCKNEEKRVPSNFRTMFGMKEIPDEGAVLTSMKKFVEYVVLGWLQILLNNVYNDNILSVVSGKNICENIWSVMWWFHYREANLGLLL